MSFTEWIDKSTIVHCNSHTGIFFNSTIGMGQLSIPQTTKKMYYKDQKQVIKL